MGERFSVSKLCQTVPVTCIYPVHFSSIISCCETLQQHLQWRIQQSMNLFTSVLNGNITYLT